MCLGGQQPKPDINKPNYRPNEMRDHFTLKIGNKVIQRGDPKRTPKDPKDDTTVQPPLGPHL